METVKYSLNHLLTHPEAETWGTYLFVERGADPQRRRLVGFGGFKGAPAVDGSVEIGYSVVPECQRRGLATEAVLGFLAHAFGDQRVNRVVAETFPELVPSQGVLAKAGFTFIGPGSEPGVLRFALTRDEWIPQ
jgi:ribosomal-protein-alanine N-acetyltransferase